MITPQPLIRAYLQMELNTIEYRVTENMNFGEGCLLTNTQIIQSERSGGTSIETWQKVYVYSQQYTTVREDQSLQGNAHVLGKELINWINMSCSFSILSAACQQTFKCI